MSLGLQHVISPKLPTHNCVCVVLCFRSPTDEDVVHNSFKTLIDEQSQDLNSDAEAIGMYPLKEENEGTRVNTHALKYIHI